MLDAGKYYIGDLCYVLGDKNGFDWIDTLKSTGYLSSETGMFELKGVKFFSSRTNYGDGYFKDGEGRGYGVDAGIIGCFPVDALEDGDGLMFGHVVSFKEGFKCTPCDSEGVIQMGNVLVRTGDIEWEHDDD